MKKQLDEARNTLYIEMIMKKLQVLEDYFKEYFSWHISFPGNFPGRIYFLPDAEQRVGIIGYLGKHLPTKNYPTI